MTKFIYFNHDDGDGDERQLVLATDQIKLIYTDVRLPEELEAEHSVTKAYYEAINAVAKELGENITLVDFQKNKNGGAPIGSIVIETLDGDTFVEPHYAVYSLLARFSFMRDNLVRE